MDFAKIGAVNEGVLTELLLAFRRGEVTLEDVLARLRHLPYEDLGFAKPDHHRHLRQGFPEVVFGQGKTPEQIAAIVARLLAHSALALVTRTDEAAYAAVRRIAPEAVYHAQARMITIRRGEPPEPQGLIAVVSAGTADIPVAEEAAVTAEALGNRVERFYDVGVAGLHRLLSVYERLQAARVIVCVAGMEGALPSVVGGLVSVPVIAVPTSIGYGVGQGGVAALLGMLNSCSANVVVVNIDNGFGAGFVASLINRKAH
ncbi:MAG: nickel pincer cofactor biosynthesis protein LarB [Blastocatellia bacterium]|nr:nickel pincer cofactor biosynthesis protein LarB [Blastocatellia bacterium]MCS7156374.1 nickel pincer cofactor biosynthesis protein LarB [Blastocatellia bacterium]MCX7751275.1 nickel pincer cofactor biosynthesis protein LarB [Blastocatellia bacterium]MDW8168987.1 nickel pincer cofactor biosynthesis protein LarB [Acidobacteriota bacterium]MDW8256747.1 nickel pincer cofactor biosynthesis protein LarB [Acidobacteriota bacterium]